MKARHTEPVPRVALTLEEAAQALGVSLSTFRRHVLEHVKTVPLGSARIVDVDELRRYVAREAR